MKIKTYSELILLPTFEERFEYLKLPGRIGVDTFGCDRFINQTFYNSPQWREVRERVIIRDDGCDLGLPDHPIFESITVHHMNAITIKDIEDVNPDIFDMEFLISCRTHTTHKSIHYGSEVPIRKFVERRPNDTIPWKGGRL